MSTAETMAVDGTTMTVEEFLALRDDGIDRELIRGVVKVRGRRGMTYRNRFHSGVEATLARLLGNWLLTRPAPRGKIVSGEAGFRLQGRDGSVVGIDVAYVSADLIASTGPRQAIFDGPPVLAIEILSGSDEPEDVAEKVALYLEVGTVVWVVNPYFETVTVHRPGCKTQATDTDDELSGESYLPGFHAKVAEFFE